MKAAIFGDVGGHTAPFLRALEQLGVNLVSGVIPEDLHIIQVGDLIHKGPGTDELILVVDRLMSANPGQWTQIIGNHEAMHLSMSVPFWRCDCSPTTISTLQKWRADGTLRLATAFAGTAPERLVRQETLVTHAGLTAGMWSLIKRPKTAAEAVSAIDKATVGVFGRPGVMLGERTRWNAGVFWAHSTMETYPSWIDLIMPFNQVHGHCPPYNFDRSEWWSTTPPLYRRGKPYTYAYQSDRTYVCHTDGGATFVCVDPGFSRQEPKVQVQPWLEVQGFVQLA